VLNVVEIGLPLLVDIILYNKYPFSIVKYCNFKRVFIVLINAFNVFKITKKNSQSH